MDQTQKKVDNKFISGLAYCKKCLPTLKAKNYSQDEYSELWSSAARRNILITMDNKMLMYGIRCLGAQQLRERICAQKSSSQCEEQIDTYIQLYDMDEGSLNTPDRVDVDEGSKKINDVKSPEHNDSGLIDLCDDSDDNVEQSKVPSNLVTTQPRRQRRIDICMEAASKSVKEFSDDSDDVELKELVADALSKEFIHPDNIPEWYSTLIDDKTITDDDKYRRLMAADFVTDNLMKEVESYYPNSTNNSSAARLLSEEKCIADFEKNCIKLLRIGRLFINYKQLFQVVKLLGIGWNFEACIQSKTIRCHYSDTESNYKKIENWEKRRQAAPSMKKQVDCPFLIRFAYVKYLRHKKKKPVFYKVKVTEVNASYTCSLSKEFVNQANRVSRGKNKYNLSKLTTIVDILKHDPDINTNSLRSLLKDCVPHDIWINAKFIGNFRHRVALYLSRGVDDSNVSSDDATFM